MKKPYELNLQLFGEKEIMLADIEDDEDLEDLEDEDIDGDEDGAIEEPTEDEEKPDEKVYTEEELNARVDEILARKIARKEAKIRKEYEEKIAKLENAENVLNAGLGTESLDDALDELTEYYQSKGIKVPTAVKQKYSEKEERILGVSEADEIIAAGLDDVIEEVDRLAAIGNDKRSPREQAMFLKLAEHRQHTETLSKFKSLGVSEETIQSEEFRNFSKKFNSEVSPEEILELYQTKQGKQTKKRDVIGSMSTPPTTKIKDYYTPEEVDKLTLDDLDDPQIMAAVEKSMSKWK